MRRTLCAVVLALSGCGSVEISTPQPALPHLPVRELRLPEPRYTETLRSLILLEDLYFQSQRIFYLLDRCSGYGSIDLTQGGGELREWSLQLAAKVYQRLERSQIEGTPWRVTPRLLQDIEVNARTSVYRSFSAGPVNLTPELRKMANYAFRYHESGNDTHWLVDEDPMMSTLLVESGLWSEN